MMVTDTSMTKSVAQWRRLHDKGYFQGHPHYVGWPIIDQSVSIFAGHIILRSNDDVLEIGCGYGNLMYGLADHVRSIVGVDVHRQPLDKARELLQEKENATVVLTDGISLPFKNGSFSLVYSYSVMQHIPRELVRRYMTESRRVLKLGGCVFLQFINADKSPNKRRHINLDVAREQAIAWTTEEIVRVADGIALYVSIYKKGLSLCFKGVAI